MNKNLLPKTIDTFLNVLKSASIKDLYANTLADLPDLLSGNPISYFLLFKRISDISLSDCIFYTKLDRFFRGIEDIDYENRIDFISKHINGKEKQFAKKVLENIDIIDDEDKAELIANLQRALFYEKIDVGVFFRLIKSVRETSLEDLYFLSQNQNVAEFKLNISVDFLTKSGLMYNYSLGNNTWEGLYKSNIFCISDLGKLLIKHCLNYGNTARLLNENIRFFSSSPLEVKETLLCTDSLVEEIQDKIDTTARFS